MENPLYTSCTQVFCIQRIPLQLSLYCKDSKVSSYYGVIIITLKSFSEYTLLLVRIIHPNNLQFQSFFSMIFGYLLIIVNQKCSFRLKYDENWIYLIHRSTHVQVELSSICKLRRVEEEKAIKAKNICTTISVFRFLLLATCNNYRFRYR